MSASAAAAAAAANCPICEYAVVDSVTRDATYTSRNPRERVTCAACAAVACRLCVQKFLLTLHEEPCCMHCRAQWSMSFVSRVCSVSFVTGPLRKHRGLVLYERERAWMPISMEQAELRRAHQRRTALAYEIDRQRQNIADTVILLRDAELLPRTAEAMQRALHEMRTIPAVQARRVIRFGRDITTYRVVPNDDADGDQETAAGGAGTEAANRRAQFTRPCPAPDCRGMLNAAFRCAICAARVCRQCLEIKARGGLDAHDADAAEAQHACNPDAVASAAALKQSCKPCPNCAALIYKIEGCDQMFCTACNTPFLWSTLAILRTGFIHNPHYFEFLDHMRRQGVAEPANLVMRFGADQAAGAAAADAGARDPCSVAARRTRLQNLYIPTSPQSIQLVSARTLALEVVVMLQAIADGRELWGARNSLRKLARDIVRNSNNFPPPERNADLRLAYINQELSEDALRTQLSRREILQERAAELLHIFTFMTDAVMDALLRRSAQRTHNQPALERKEHEETRKEVVAILQYSRTQVDSVVARYKRATWCPDDDCVLVQRTYQAKKRTRASDTRQTATQTQRAQTLNEDEDDDEINEDDENNEDEEINEDAADATDDPQRRRQRRAEAIRVNSSSSDEGQDYEDEHDVSDDLVDGNDSDTRDGWFLRRQRRRTVLRFAQMTRHNDAEQTTVTTTTTNATAEQRAQQIAQDVARALMQFVRPHNTNA